LVLAPKTILAPAWGQDRIDFFPDYSHSIAYAKNREEAFKMDADIIITNHDAVIWMSENLNRTWLESEFDTLIVDESGAFKNPKVRSVQRVKALRSFFDLFEHRSLLNGTPNPNTITELWQQMYLIDHGERLGKSFYRFQDQVTDAFTDKYGITRRKDKADIEEVVYSLISDVTIRHEFDKSIPDNHEYKVYYQLPAKARKVYMEMQNFAVAQINEGEFIQATQASSVKNKLLQIASGAVYDGSGDYKLIDRGRYELIMDIVEARSWPCLVGFLWKHQRDELLKEAKRRKTVYAVIDGDTKDHAKEDIVKKYQDGAIKVVFAHPKSAAHGLTLTRGRTAIWASPTYQADWWKQFKHRIWRAGQEEKSETIMVEAEDTFEKAVYDDALAGKLERMGTLLTFAEQTTKLEKQK